MKIENGVLISVKNSDIKKGNFTIPNSVTSIGNCAFENCTGLTSITIPNSVTSIGNCAFYNCTGLTSITIPNSITSIGDWAFENCTGLTSITIPNSVTSIGDWAFYNCTGLTSITIPNSVTSIGNCAFYNCTGLTSITIPNSVTSIGYRAFENCTGLTSITIPNSVTSIGDWAFENCTGLTSITIQKFKTEQKYKTMCADGYLIFVTNHRNFSEKVEIYAGNLFKGMKDKKIQLEKCVLVSQGNYYAHGETLKKAMEDLTFKMAKDRGSEQYRDLTLNSELTLENAIACYRIITGACQFGTEQFLKSIKPKEKYKISEIITITKGQFGGEQFKEFFE